MPNTPENGLILFDPKELVKSANIRVTRSRVAGANVFGRPYADDIDSRTFSEIQEALSWVQGAPEYSHNFEFPVPQIKIDASLRGPKRSEKEKLLVYSHKERPSVNPRTLEGHHFVSTDYRTHFDLGINLQPFQHTFFDRGVVWINLDDITPVLKFNINAGVHKIEEMHNQLSLMSFRVNNVLNDLIKNSS